MPDQFIVKFNETVVPMPDVNGYIQTGITWVDQLNISNSIVTAEPLFNPGIALSPDDPFYTDGLDKCFVFKSSHHLNIETVIAQYAGAEIDYCEPDYYPNTDGDLVPEEETETPEFINRLLGNGRGNLIPQDTEAQKQWYLFNQGHRPNYGFDPGLQSETIRGYTSGVDVNVLQAWDVTCGHPSWTVAVCSDGLGVEVNNSFFLHSDLDPIRKVTGFNVAANNNDTSENYLGSFIYYNGTVFSGIIAAKSNNSGAEPNITGVDWGCRIMPIKVWDTNPQQATMSILCKGINWASTHGADVILITQTYNYDSSGDDVKYLRLAVGDALKRDALCVAPAYTSSFEKAMPGGFPELLSVAGIYSDGTIAAPATEHYPYLDVCAPIDNIFNLGWSYFNWQGGPIPFSQYRLFWFSRLYGSNNNAALSAAIAAGCVSLARCANPSKNAQEIKELIQSTCTDWSTSGWDDRTGWGLINTTNAVHISKVIEAKDYIEKKKIVIDSFAISPNPANSDITIHATLNRVSSESYTINISDVSGKLVHKRTIVPSGSDIVYSWNGCNDQGNKVANGIYVICLSGSSVRSYKRVAITK